MRTNDLTYDAVRGTLEMLGLSAPEDSAKFNVIATSSYAYYKEERDFFFTVFKSGDDSAIIELYDDNHHVITRELIKEDYDLVYLPLLLHDMLDLL